MEEQNNNNNLINQTKEFIKTIILLIQEHIKLLKQEFSENANKVVAGVVSVIIALVIAYIGLIFFGFLLVYLLYMTDVPAWVALLSVTALYFGVPLILIIYALSLFHGVFKKPKKSFEELEKTGDEVKKWMKNIQK